ncbi:unnamed protein product, partial [Medioppia subpectinata]
MEPLHLCMDRYTVHLDLIRTMDPDTKISAVCCGFHLFQDCIQKSTQSLCEPKTGIETADYIMSIINSMTNDVLDFTCGRFENIEKCDKYMEEKAWNALKEPKSAEEIVTERAKQKFVSPIPALVAVITNYEL